jgi:hypothetical protein
MGDCPDKHGQFTSDGDDRDLSWLVALGQAPISPVQPVLRPPCDLDDRGGTAVPSLGDSARWCFLCE